MRLQRSNCVHEAKFFLVDSFGHRERTVTRCYQNLKLVIGRVNIILVFGIAGEDGTKTGSMPVAATPTTSPRDPKLPSPVLESVILGGLHTASAPATTLHVVPNVLATTIPVHAVSQLATAMPQNGISSVLPVAASVPGGIFDGHVNQYYKMDHRIASFQVYCCCPRNLSWLFPTCLPAHPSALFLDHRLLWDHLTVVFLVSGTRGI